MRGKWASRIGWTLLVLFTLGAMSDGHDVVAAVMFLAGVVIYWGGRIEEAVNKK